MCLPASRKESPINHGPCSPDRLLERAAEVVRTHFIERANSIQFNMIALAAADGRLLWQVNVPTLQGATAAAAAAAGAAITHLRLAGDVLLVR